MNENEDIFKRYPQLKKIVFWKTFPTLIDREKSPLSKFLLQQNLIAFEITQALVAIERLVNYCVLRSTVGTEDVSRGFTPRINLPPPRKLLEDKTLGQLISLFKTFAPLGASDLIGPLEDYNAQRNSLVHKMFTKYDNIENINIDATKAAQLGARILPKIVELQLRVEATQVELERELKSPSPQPSPKQ